MTQPNQPQQQPRQLTDEEREKVEECMQVVQEVLKEYKCTIVPVVNIIGDNISTGLSFQLIPEENRIIVPDVAQKTIDKVKANPKGNIEGGK